MAFYQKHPKLVQFLGILVGFFALIAIIPQDEGNYLWRLPSLLAWLPGWINTLADNLMFNWFQIDVWDPDLEEYEKSALIREVTRGTGYDEFVAAQSRALAVLSREIADEILRLRGGD